MLGSANDIFDFVVLHVTAPGPVRLKCFYCYLAIKDVFNNLWPFNMKLKLFDFFVVFAVADC